jgi:6,7-dimethyl-8-ribityllumazine synthase
MNEISGQLVATGLKFGIVVSRFNDYLTKNLLSGAQECLVRHGAADDDITVVWVPGANEGPMAAHQLALMKRFDAIIVLGCVIEGATPHAELINSMVENAISSLAREFSVPVLNGVVAARTLEQAIERCGTKGGNRGWSAAQAAVEMANLYRRLRQGRS